MTDTKTTVGADRISELLQRIIDERTEPWGIKVISVEVKDDLIPPALKNAMSMQAQAERERQARVILGDAERQIAEKFNQAGKSYEHNPIALRLRAMNMLYEGLKENATNGAALVNAEALRRLHGCMAAHSIWTKEKATRQNIKQGRSPRNERIAVL